jgi:hypothetical protein
MMKKIFKLNALIALGYTVFFVSISFLFNRFDRSIFPGIVYSFVACIHFMIMGVLMTIWHFKQVFDKRNGYMASFGFIWMLIIIVNIFGFYL